MADLMTGTSTWATGVADTATTLLNGVDQKKAEHINGPAAAIVALETVLGSASSLKGSHADLATRLAVALPADGKLIPPGTIWAYAGSAAPTGWQLCDGAPLSRSAFADLFAVIGTDFGAGLGDGLTFSKPDLRGRVMVGAGTGTGGGASGTTGTAPSGGSSLFAWLRGAWRGHDTHTLAVTEMPAHTHSVGFRAGTGTFTGAGANGWDGVLTTTSGSAGSGAAHNIMQASLGMNFIIKT